MVISESEGRLTVESTTEVRFESHRMYGCLENPVRRWVLQAIGAVPNG